jgi:hypothetical protein
MSTNTNASTKTEVSTAPEAPSKKPYVKPEFRYEQVFVTTALSCGKTVTEGQCFNRSSAS